jgi:hypothetical protein
VSVHDIAGRRVATLFSGRAAAGEHAATWNLLDEAGAPAPAGVYLLRLEQSGHAASTKVIVQRP